MKKGFTIVEMLMVVGVLSVLMGIVTIAATASIRQSRQRRMEACKHVIEDGIATYLAQKDKWPGKLESWSDNGAQNGKVGYLSNNDYDEIMQTLLKVSTGKAASSPVFDATTLFVMPQSAADGRKSAREFRDAVKKKQKHSKTMSVSEMTVVYQSPHDIKNTDCAAGRFYRFIVQYNAETDHVRVMTRKEYYDAHGKWDGSEKWF